jgi:enoyl-CoA hydratase/carnithine racemase
MVCLGSPLATRGAVRLYRLTGAFPEPLLTYARYMDQDIAETEDGQEGARAFREKRRPEWRLK